MAVEALRIRNMTASAKGTVEAPGKNVRAKAGLNRSILEQRWGIMLSQLRYKAEWAGAKVVEVDPSYTSQTCSNCGVVCRANRRGKLYSCSTCGVRLDADVNAAVNISAAWVDHARAETLSYGSAGWATTPYPATAFVVGGVSRINPRAHFGVGPRRAGRFLRRIFAGAPPISWPQARGEVSARAAISGYRDRVGPRRAGRFLRMI